MPPKTVLVIALSIVVTALGYKGDTSMDNNL